MKEFSLKTSALQEIRQRIAEYSLESPVVALCDSASLNRLLKNNDFSSSGDEEIAEYLGKVILDKNQKLNEEVECLLDVNVYSATQCNNEDLRDICGIKFAMASFIFERLNGFSLEYEEESFCFVSPNEIVNSLNSLLSK